MNTPKPFTSFQKHYVEKNLSKQSVKEIAYHLNMNINHLNYYLSKHGLRSTATASSQSETSQETNYLSTYQEVYIKNNYLHKPMKDIVAHLKISVYFFKKYMEDNNLEAPKDLINALRGEGKRKPLTKFQIDYILKNRLKQPMIVMAEHLNLSLYRVRKYMTQNNLKVPTDIVYQFRSVSMKAHVANQSSSKSWDFDALP